MFPDGVVFPFTASSPPKRGVSHAPPFIILSYLGRSERSRTFDHCAGPSCDHPLLIPLMLRKHTRVLTYFFSFSPLDQPHRFRKRRGSSLVLQARSRRWLDVERPTGLGWKVQRSRCPQRRLQRSIPGIRYRFWRRPHSLECHCLLAVPTGLDLERSCPSQPATDVHPHWNDRDFAPAKQHR